MQSIQVKCNRLIRAMAPAGNLFFLLTVQELRRQGLTFFSFYVLQRIIREPGLSECRIQEETGLSNYEVSRACNFLVRSRLAKKERYEKDRRVQLLTATERGVRARDQILLAASAQLKEGWSAPGQLRRFSKATASILKANRMLFDPLQLSIFDTDLFEKDSRKSVAAKRTAGHLAHGHSRRSKP